MADAYRAVAEGRLADAAALAGPMRYDVVDLTDAATGDRFVLLREGTDERGDRKRNWGLHVHTPGSVSRLVVQVTHPRYDIDSHLVGREVWRIGGGRALFVAGTHRYANADGSADVAHREDSVFHALHVAATTAGDVVYQPHGFSQVKHPDLGDIVVSGGTAPTPALVTATATALADPYVVCLYDGTACTQLAATTNVQGQAARAADATFVHVEHAGWIRDSAEHRHGVAVRTAGILAG